VRRHRRTERIQKVPNSVLAKRSNLPIVDEYQVDHYHTFATTTILLRPLRTISRSTYQMWSRAALTLKTPLFQSTLKLLQEQNDRSAQNENGLQMEDNSQASQLNPSHKPRLTNRRENSHKYSPDPFRAARRVNTPSHFALISHRLTSLLPRKNAARRTSGQ